MFKCVSQLINPVKILTIRSQLNVMISYDKYDKFEFKA